MSDAGFVLDAGAFIALERQNRLMLDIVAEIREQNIPLVTSAGVVAQVWRGGTGKQVPIAFLLRRTRVMPLDDRVARVIGKRLGLVGNSDPVDGHVAYLAGGLGWTVITSDPGDLKEIDPYLTIEVI